MSQVRSAVLSLVILAAGARHLAAQQGHVPGGAGQTPQPAASARAPGEIRGAVRGDSTAGAALPRASITVRDAADSSVVSGVFADGGGAFRVPGLAAGRYLVRASLLGRRAVTKLVVVTPQKPALDAGVFVLVPEAIALEGVTGRVQRAALTVAPDRNVYNVKNLPVAGSGSATDVLRTVPEVEVDAEGNVSMQGSQSVAVHLNGRPVPVRGDALRAFLQQIPASRIDRVEVVPNPSARYDPEGMSGILNLVLKEGAGLGLSGSASARLDSRRRLGGTQSLAFQRGRLTLFGSASVMSSENGMTGQELRRNLLPTAASRVEVERSASSRFINGFADASVEYRLGARSTLFGSVRAGGAESRNDAIAAYSVFDPAGEPMQRFDQLTDSEHRPRLLTAGLGFRRVVQPGQHELSVDLRQVSNRMPMGYHFERVFFATDGAALDATVAGSRDTEVAATERSLQADFMRPLGAAYRVDAGLRVAGRATDFSQTIDGGADRGAFGYEERFGQAYLLLTRRFGRLSLQAGMRAEEVATEVLPASGARFENRYHTIYPSAELSYAPREGTQARLSYTKRVERPSHHQLNPFVYASDSLNRSRGNPYLRPKYTHAVALDLTRTTGFGTVKLSPFYRRTVDNWDEFRTVDSAGVATTMPRNSRSVATLGATSSLSLRWGGRSNAFVSLTGLRYDRRDVEEELSRSGFRWSVSGNALVNVLAGWDLQATARYSSPLDVPQGRMGATLWSSLGVRCQLSQRLVATATVTDPLGVHRFRMETRDRTFEQDLTHRMRIRTATFALSYDFGRRPQSARRPPEQQPEMEVVQ